MRFRSLSILGGAGSRSDDVEEPPAVLRGAPLRQRSVSAAPRLASLASSISFGGNRAQILDDETTAEAGGFNGGGVVKFTGELVSTDASLGDVLISLEVGSDGLGLRKTSGEMMRTVSFDELVGWGTSGSNTGESAPFPGRTRPGSTTEFYFYVDVVACQKISFRTARAAEIVAVVNQCAQSAAEAIEEGEEGEEEDEEDDDEDDDDSSAEEDGTESDDDALPGKAGPSSAPMPRSQRPTPDEPKSAALPPRKAGLPSVELHERL